MTIEVPEVPPAATAIDIAGAERKTARRERTKLLFSSPAFVFGSFIVAFWVFCAAFPSVLTRFDPRDTAVTDDGELLGFHTSPNGNAWFGTDSVGRDVFSRVVAGARPIMVDAFAAAALAVIAGTVLGLIMGYKRGWIDELLSRFVEAFLSLPVILIGVLATATIGKSRIVIIAIVAVLFTPIVARTVRSSVSAQADLDYVTSARLRGESSMYIMAREIFPNVTATIVVELTVRIAYAIFTLATLAFLGLTGSDLALPDWGKDIAAEFRFLPNDTWWSTIFPALAIATLIVAVNLIADTIDRVNKS